MPNDKSEEAGRERTRTFNPEKPIEERPKKPIPVISTPKQPEKK